MLHVGDTVDVKSGWLRGKTFRGKVVYIGDTTALVYGDNSLSNYKFKNITLVERAQDNVVLDALRELYDKVKHLL